MSQEFTTLTFDKARLNICIGHTEEERQVSQEIDLAVSIRFSEPPPACVTDKLTETICYDELISAARAFCEGQEFQLIERLTNDLHKLLKGMLPASASLWVETTKLNPPVKELYGGVSFSFGDFQPNK